MYFYVFIQLNHMSPVNYSFAARWSAVKYHLGDGNAEHQSKVRGHLSQCGVSEKLRAIPSAAAI